MSKILEMKNIGKRYGDNTILKDVNLSIEAGEIHALLGENGAGKSTLMNILFGMPVIHSTGGFTGSIKMNDEDVSIQTPTDAMEKGIGMVHQEFMLIPEFTVTENIKLNRENLIATKLTGKLGKDFKLLDLKKMKIDSRTALDTIGIDLREDALVKGLPVGHMQFIEIARELDKENMKLLVFDEPTAVLTESEADTLLTIMKNIASKGVAIIFITHRLDEVMEVADSITVLRDGEVAKTLHKKDTNVLQLAELMVGRKVDLTTKEETEEKLDKVLLAIENLQVNMPGEKVKGVNLEIYEGEILGIGGLAGQGKIGISNGIMGIYPAEGQVSFEGGTLELNKPQIPLSKGLAFVSEDRRGMGLLLDDSIENNMVVTAMKMKNEFLMNLGIAKIQHVSKIRSHAREMIEKLDIRCTGPGQMTKELSGGNQQKVCLARALTLGPKLLFVSEPTRGIDIGAKKLVLDLLLELKKEGMTVVITSSELAELRTVADRIAIISEGKVAGIVKPSASDAEFGLLMSGLKGEGGENL